MEHYTKIHPAEIHRLVDWRSLRDSAKRLFLELLPVAKPLSFAILAGVALLVLQVIIIGISDRFGISPKISLILSSLFYSFVFAAIAIVGGLKIREIREFANAQIQLQPICKILIIKRKNQETQI
jgi:hypothetical protein